MQQKFTITIYTENNPGLLHRVLTVFTRRKINIENITASESEVPGIYRYTIVVIVSAEMVIKVVNQLERIVDVIKAFYYEDEDLVHQEIALYKVPTEAFLNGNVVEALVRNHNARILEIEEKFTVIEKTGHKEETQQLLEELEPFGVFEFVRSGRVVVSKLPNKLHEYLSQLEENKEN